MNGRSIVFEFVINWNERIVVHVYASSEIVVFGAWLCNDAPVV